MKHFILLFLFISSSSSFSAEYTRECRSLPGPVDGGYCIHKPMQNASSDVVYHLHGLGGSQFTWSDELYYTQQLRDEWSRMNIKRPTVVSFSFGPAWILAEKNSKLVSGLFELVVDRFIPFVESEIGSDVGRRLLLGESMGGFNSTQLAFKTHLFTKAAILCAPMSEVSPFASREEILNYVKTTAAWKYHEKRNQVGRVLESVELSLQMVHTFFPNEMEWQRSDPLNLSEMKMGNFPEIYLAIGLHDSFAAFEANQVFARKLHDNGVLVDWRPQWGGHCSIDIPSLAKFLVE